MQEGVVCRREHIWLSFYAARLKRRGFSSFTTDGFTICDPSKAGISFSHLFKGNEKEFSQYKTKMKARDEFPEAPGQSL